MVLCCTFPFLVVTICNFFAVQIPWICSISERVKYLIFFPFLTQNFPLTIMKLSLRIHNWLLMFPVFNRMLSYCVVSHRFAWACADSRPAWLAAFCPVPRTLERLDRGDPVAYHLQSITRTPADGKYRVAPSGEIQRGNKLRVY